MKTLRQIIFENMSQDDKDRIKALEAENKALRKAYEKKSGDNMSEVVRIMDKYRP